MSDEMLVRFCSPTLAGLKTGNLFSYSMDEQENMEQTIRSLNRRLSGKGIVAVLLRKTEKKALIYLYRPEFLRRDWQRDDAGALLAERGYDTEHPGKCISKLARQVREAKDFPHEIGLFLGYPAVDVRGFIENHAMNYKTAGLWKVYGDEDSAVKTFRRFKNCTSTYTKLWKQGRPIEELAIKR